MGYNQEIMDDGYSFEFSGGALCLDFTNTLGDRPRCANEHLNEYSDLLHWAVQAGVVEDSRASVLRTAAVRDPRAAAQGLRRALELRECLFGLFSSLVAGRSPSEEELERLNEFVAATMRRVRLEKDLDGFRLAFATSSRDLTPMLGPVVQSAIDLLVSGERQLVRQCASETCSWLFVDRSRTRRRRWCDMKTCGNRAKAKRHYQRKRKQQAG